MRASKEIRYIDNRAKWWPDSQELWASRNIIYMWAKRNIKARYKQAALGVLWAVLTPVAFTLAFVWFFHAAAANASGGLPAVPSALAGLILWQFFSRGLLDGASSLAGNANIISKVYFPRIVLPLAAVASALFDFCVSLLLLVAIFVYYSVPVGPQLLVMPVFIAWVATIVLALSLWLSSIDAYFRDVRHALPILLQIGMLLTPAAYVSSSLIPKEWLWVYSLNPLVGPIEGFRWATIVGAPFPSSVALVSSLCFTTVGLITGLVFFSITERSVVDRV